MALNPYTGYQSGYHRRFQSLGGRNSVPGLVPGINGGLAGGGLMGGALSRRVSLPGNFIGTRNPFINQLAGPVVNPAALVRSSIRGANLSPYYPQNIDPRMVGLHNLQPQYNQQSICNCNQCLQNCHLYGYPSNSCSHQQDSCGDCHSCRSHKGSYDFKTKDVTIRGKAHKIRASYLLEASKFEADIVKYMDKKKDDMVPDRVVEMLVEFINREQYTCSDILDEVTLNILASNTGSKSAGDYSLSRLKKWDRRISAEKLLPVVVTVLMSSKVDDGLKNWLKKLLEDGWCEDDRRVSRRDVRSVYEILTCQRMDVALEVERLLGMRSDKEDEIKGARVL